MSADADRDARRAARVPAQSPLAYEFLRVVGKAALVPFFRLKTVGLENVPREGPVVIASLHRSNWDSLAVGVRLPRRMRPMAKIELMRAPVLGWFLRHGGAFPVRRGETDTQAIASALSILRAGGMLLMFPEGTRNRDGRATVQPGAARIALQGKAAIVPVAVLNTDRARLLPPRFPQFRVAYGPPLDLSDLAGTSLRVAAVEATARWERAVAELRASLEDSIESSI
jgi:1-acyl-sn-glycerol-3-phosphate acyltransferase